MTDVLRGCYGSHRGQAVAIGSWRGLAVAFLAVLAALLALHFTCLAFWPKSGLDPMNLSDFYPLSVFKLRVPHLYQWGVGALLALCFGLSWPRLSGTPRLPVVLLGGLVFAVLSNLLHGFRFGLDYPTATKGDAGIEYYHDAIWIPGPLWLLEHYNAIQFELLEHARTHPPGPVLLYWSLYRALHYPAAISVAITALSLALALPYWRRLLRLTLGEVPAGALALYTLLPALLIYGLATVDALIAPLFLATVVAFIDDERRLGWLEAALFLFLSLCFTFGALFLLPVLGGFELLRRRRVTQSALVIGAAALALLLLKPVCGFDWWRAFWKAASMENEDGFLLFAAPKRYLWYRIGGVAEIALFFTPFLLVLWARGWTELKRLSRDGWVLAWLGPLSLAAMLLAGALKIGEAARVCLFILPYLLLPTIAAWRVLERDDQARIAWSVLAYGMGMQLFGFYQW